MNGPELVTHRNHALYKHIKPTSKSLRRTHNDLLDAATVGVVQWSCWFPCSKATRKKDHMYLPWVKVVTYTAVNGYELSRVNLKRCHATSEHPCPHGQQWNGNEEIMQKFDDNIVKGHEDGKSPALYIEADIFDL